MKLEWKKQADGSYTSVAGRIWKYSTESWQTCCVTASNELTGWKNRGRIGNLRETKRALECAWTMYLAGLQINDLRKEFDAKAILEITSWEPLRLNLRICDLTPETVRQIANILGTTPPHIKNQLESA